jgi:hypothetical protein
MDDAPPVPDMDATHCPVALSHDFPGSHDRVIQNESLWLVSYVQNSYVVLSVVLQWRDPSVHGVV